MSPRCAQPEHRTDNLTDCGPPFQHADAQFQPLEGCVSWISLESCFHPGACLVVPAHMLVCEGEIKCGGGVSGTQPQGLMTGFDPLLISSDVKLRDSQVLPPPKILRINLHETLETGDRRAVLRGIEQQIGQIHEDQRLLRPKKQFGPKMLSGQS